MQKTTDYHDFSTKDMPVKERRDIGIGDIWMNRIKCKKCEDIIISNNRHDFKYCKCKSIFVDGGSWYGRAGGNLEDIEDMIEMFDNLEEK